MSNQPIKTNLNLLRYHLEEVKALTRNPCWKHYEYKYYILSHGIAHLESMQGRTDSLHNGQVDELLKDYRNALYTIL